jgi:hypothetical protein
MNDQKVCKMVAYVKPILGLIELEVEGSLLLTASGDPGSIRFGGNVSGAGNTAPGASNGGKWNSTTGTAVGGSGMQSVKSGGRHSF